MPARPTIQLRGVYRHSLDDKNRVIVPQALRGKGAQEVIIVQHPRSYLAIMTTGQFDKLHQHLMEEYPEADQQRDFAFVLNHMARAVTIDAQGRMNLAQPEIEHAGIDREVIITGSHRSQFEMWAPARHAAAVQEKRDAVGAMLQKLGI
jgi:MraZ protein